MTSGRVCVVRAGTRVTQLSSATLWAMAETVSHSHYTVMCPELSRWLFQFNTQPVANLPLL